MAVKHQSSSSSSTRVQPKSYSIIPNCLILVVLSVCYLSLFYITFVIYPQPADYVLPGSYCVCEHRTIHTVHTQYNAVEGLDSLVEIGCLFTQIIDPNRLLWQLTIACIMCEVSRINKKCKCVRISLYCVEHSDFYVGYCVDISVPSILSSVHRDDALRSHLTTGYRPRRWLRVCVPAMHVRYRRLDRIKVRNKNKLL